MTVRVRLHRVTASIAYTMSDYTMNKAPGSITMNRILAAAFIAAWFCVSSVQAAITFFHDDPVGFSTAASADYQLLGVETFEEAVMADPGSAGFASPLSPTTTNVPFPSGILQPFEIVENANANLRAFRNDAGVNSTVVATHLADRFLRLNFDPAEQISAVGFNPVTPFSASSVTGIIVQLEDGTTSPFLQISSDDAGTRHLGILTDPGDSPIATINVGVSNVAGTLNRVRSGVDNVALYSAVPEPSTATICLLLAFVLLGKTRASRG